LAPSQARIAHLNLGIEITLLGGQQRAAAVHLDTAAFNHEVFADVLRIKQVLAEKPRPGLRPPGVLLPVVMLRPRVVVEMHDGGLARLPFAICHLPSAFIPSTSLHEDRPDVARPAARGGVVDELDAAQVGARARKETARELLVGLAVDEDADDLPRANLADDLSIDPADGFHLAGPVDLIVRPDQPGRLVPLPF